MKQLTDGIRREFTARMMVKLALALPVVMALSACSP